MKWYIILAIVMFSLLPLSCKKERADIQKTAVNMVKLPQRVRVMDDLNKIRTAIEEYKIYHDGALPKSIDELSLKLYYSKEYNYNSTTGKVKSKHYPKL